MRTGVNIAPINAVPSAKNFFKYSMRNMVCQNAREKP